MTTAEFSVLEGLNHADIATRKLCQVYFKMDAKPNMAQLYEMVWVQGHLPIRRAHVVRPTGLERVDDVDTPNECWIVENKAFSELNAPKTIMIRQEYLRCFTDIIESYTADAGDSDSEIFSSTEMYEAIGTSGSSDDMTIDSDSPHESEAIEPSTDLFSNPFDHDMLRGKKSGGLECVIVSGQPGIGKSVQLLLILILRLHAHLPTIWQAADDEATLFTEDGVFVITLSQHNVGDMSSIADFIPPCSWILFDTSPNTRSWPELIHGTGLFAVQASYPKEERSSWKREYNVRMWFMQPFTLQELLMANHWQTNPCKERYLKTFMENYAPSARTAYEQSHQLKAYTKSLQTAIDLLSDSTLRELVDDAVFLQLKLDISHHLLRFDPNANRERTVSLASRFIWEMINKRVLKGDAARQREWYSLFLTAPLSRGTAGWILDSAFHRILLSQGEWAVLELKEEMAKTKWHWKTSSSTSQFMRFESDTNNILVQSNKSSVPPPPVQTTRYMTLTSLSPNMHYYQPIQRNQATFDSFLWSGKPRGLAVVFQATVSATHSVKNSGLVWLQSLEGVKEVWYVAVTPTDITTVDFTLDDGVQDPSIITGRYHIKIKPEDFV